MGRPSSLGIDEFHNRDFPFTEVSELPNSDAELLDPPHCAIIRYMVDFSRITRHVCVKVYVTPNSTSRTVELAHQFDQVLDDWLASLPESIRPRQTPEQPSMLTSIKEAIWMKRQRLVLNIRKASIPWCASILMLTCFTRLFESEDSTFRLHTANVQPDGPYGESIHPRLI